LIPIKLIAIVFIPAALVSLWFRRNNTQVKRTEVLLASILWISGLLSVVLYNLSTIQSIVPSSHAQVDINSVLDSLVQFATSIPRNFLVTWYGSLREPAYLLPFGITLVIAFVCLLSLRVRKQNRDVLILAIVILVFAWGLSFVRQFYTDGRLLGYGLILGMIACLPASKSRFVWLLYGLITMFLAAYNMSQVNSQGLTHSQYQEVASVIANTLPTSESYTIYTNADRLLNVLERMPALSIDTPEELVAAQAGDYFVYIKLPNFDAIMRPIVVLEVPQQGWCQLSASNVFEIYQRCTATE
jgi:hypothetical protein